MAIFATKHINSAVTVLRMKIRDCFQEDQSEIQEMDAKGQNQNSSNAGREKLSVGCGK